MELSPEDRARIEAEERYRRQVRSQLDEQARSLAAAVPAFLPAEEQHAGQRKSRRIVPGIGGIGLCVILLLIVGSSSSSPSGQTTAPRRTFSNSATRRMIN